MITVKIERKTELEISIKIPFVEEETLLQQCINGDVSNLEVNFSTSSMSFDSMVILLDQIISDYKETFVKFVKV